MKATSLLALFLVSIGGAAQQPWQQMQMPTAAEVQSAWMSPEPEYGPEPYYGLNGPVDEAVIRRDLDSMKAMGYGAVTVQAGYGTTFAYLSPEYFKFFRTFVDEAKQRGLRVWIVDDAGYPSGFAGGRFTERKPELRMQALVAGLRIEVKGGETIKPAVGPDTVAVSAINVADGTSVPVPVTNGEVTWTAPPGSWTLVAVEHRFSTSPTRSDTNPKRVKDGSQSLEDYLDPAATAQYLEFTHAQYAKAVGDEFGRTILGFRGDEPDYSIAGLPWTPKFFDRFEHEKGYDVKPYLASFLGTKGAVLTDRQTRAKADYYDVFSRMFRDGFFKPQADWCAAHHLEYQVHLNHEEMEMQLTRSEGEFFRDMRFVQVPGIDSIWHQIWTDTVSDFPRLAASAAHVYGHPRAFTESFAAYRPEPDVTMARYVLNEQFVRGINLVETMYFPASSTSGRGPSPYMRDPGYPALLTYTRRMSYLMSMGRPAAAVALYLPSSSMWLGDAASDAQFVSAERLLSEHQIDFDIVDEDALASELKAGRGTLTTLSGNSFRTVIVPSATVLSEAALTRLRAFAHTGGKVLFLGHTPRLIAGRTILDARASTPADFAWATIVFGDLPETPTPPAQPPAAPPAAMVVAPDTVRALAVTAGVQDASLQTADTAVRMIERQWKDATVFLLFNESAAAISNTVTFPGKSARVEAWDPQTGKVSPVDASKANGRLAVPLALAPYEARVLVLR